MRSDFQELVKQETERAELSKKVLEIMKRISLEDARRSFVSQEKFQKIEQCFIEQEKTLDREALQRKQEIESMKH